LHNVRGEIGALSPIIYGHLEMMVNATHDIEENPFTTSVLSAAIPKPGLKYREGHLLPLRLDFRDMSGCPER